MRRKNWKRKMAFLLAAALVAGAAPQTGLSAWAATGTTQEEYEDIVGTYSIDPSVKGYQEYASANPQVYPDQEYRISAVDYVRYEENGVSVTPEIYDNYENIPGGGRALLTSEEALVEFEVDVKESGFYDLSLVYYPVEGKSSEIQRAFFVDGKLPYSELALIELKRVWVTNVTETAADENGIVTRLWQVDSQGNDVKPRAVEAPEWVETYLYDSNGYVTTPLSLYLEAGKHTITMMSQREPMLLSEIVLSNREKIMDYASAKAAWDAAGYRDSVAESIRIEGENADKTSSQMLYPRQDQSSPAVYPSSPKVLLNNTIGGTSWQQAGQWVEWNFEVPSSGYYNISAYCKQNFVRGIDVCRRISIDGVVPFEEMNDYGLGYEQSWR